MHKLKHRFKPRAKHRVHHHQQARRRARNALLTTAAICCAAFGLARAEAGVAPHAVDAKRSGESREARLARWQESFDAFAAADRAHPPVAGGVLFVGSSSIRLWDSLESDFLSLQVVTKRGFGGSRLSDCSEQVARLVLPYRPSVVIVYAGDNDLAEGATPQEVAASFVNFVAAVRKELPDTRIAYLSIKPSPLRAALIERIRQTNALIEAYSATLPNLDYIDIYSKMIDADGRPRAELFRPDMLHLNRSGYSLWRTEIASHLREPAAGASNLVNAPAVPTLAVGAAPRAAH